ncbi:MAG: disulfide bond formation protein B [Proteobacteria bacterium]|nr:disulfide bond formation protein B [Pseudomonadota bacterium]
MIRPRPAPTPPAPSAPLAIAAAAAASLAVAFAAEYLGGLAPCVLCLYQRWAFAAALVLGLAGAAGHARPPLARAAVGAGALAFLAGAAIAAYHTGVERHWWASALAACGGGGAQATTVEALTRQLLATPAVRCDEIPWALFGLSIANYNLLWSAVLFVAAGLAFVRMGRGGERMP